MDGLNFQDAFGYWFSGLVDGEGCFGCWENERKIAFEISFRKDDKPTLDYILEVLGIGQIQIATETAKIPKAQYSVTNIKDCLKLVSLFERYPLRSKKSRDFEIWKKIVVMKSNKNQWEHFSPEDRNLLRDLAVQLKEIKQYAES